MKHVIGKQPVAPFLRLGGGVQMVDVDDEQSGRKCQTKFFAVRKDAGRCDIRQQLLLLFPEELSVGQCGTYLVCQLLQLFVGREISVKSGQVA